MFSSVAQNTRSNSAQIHVHVLFNLGLFQHAIDLGDNGTRTLHCAAGLPGIVQRRLKTKRQIKFTQTSSLGAAAALLTARFLRGN